LKPQQFQILVCTQFNKSHNPSLQYGQPLKRLSIFAFNLKKVIPGRFL
jgi:hypothetical protein